MQKISNTEYPNVVAENSTISDDYKENSLIMATEIINEFLPLCDIPHASGHVEEMREYLLKWGNNHNIDTNLDDSGCVYMDIPASKNCEDYPKIIFQAHFDMVAVGAKENTSYDPVTTPIKPIYDKKNNCIHTNWKTSLGADDGHGVATCLALAKLHNKSDFNYKHGPLRFLFTYDEETTLEGCKKLNPEVLDAKYLINLDSIYVGQLITSAAGGFVATGNKDLELIYAGKKSNILSISIWGLTGGHSGTDIHFNRGNTLEILKNILDEFLANSINFNFKYIKSGILMNAIPAKMYAELVVGYHDVEKAKEITMQCIQEAKEKYVDGKSLRYEIKINKSDESLVVSISDTMKIYHTLCLLPMGVIEKFDTGITKTSNNIGLVEICDGHFHVRSLYRSTDKRRIDWAARLILRNAEDTNIDFVIDCIFPAWEKTENNSLHNIILESYEKASGFIGNTLDIHAGLETGYLEIKKPGIIMASIGCDVIHEHTRKETLFTRSIPSYAASILYVLENSFKLND